jgi:hypothetical protein
MVFVGLIVEKLHLPFIQGRLFKLLVGAIGLVKGIAGDHILQAAAIEGLALPRLGEFKVGDDVRLAVNLNFQAFPQI